MTEQVTQTPEQIAQETDAAMSAGFDVARGAEPPKADPAPTSTEEPKVEESAAQAAEPKTEEPKDEWEGVSPKVKAEIEALRSSLDPITKIPDRLRNLEGHIGGLTRLTNDLKTALAQKATTAAEAKGAEAPTQAEVRSALHDPEKLKQLKEDYPDWGDAFESEIGAVHARIDEMAKKLPPPVDSSVLKTELMGDVDKRLADAAKTYEQTAEERAYQARVYAYLDFKHGIGWEEKLKTKEFEDWFGKQPKETQELSKSPLATDASKMLALYESHQKKAAEKAERDKRLDRAAQPEGVQVVASAAEDPDEAMASGFNAVRGG